MRDRAFGISDRYHQTEDEEMFRASRQSSKGMSRFVSMSHSIRVLAVATAALFLAGLTSAAVSAGKDDSYKAAILVGGTENDGGFGQAMIVGAKQAAAKYRFDLKVATNVFGSSAFEQQGNAFASAGYDLVILADSATASVTEKLAQQYPDTKFANFIAPLASLTPNSTSITPRFYEGSFLAGMIAGYLTKTNVVGINIGQAFPQPIQQAEGFALGARYANPKVKVLRTVTGSWTDVGKAEAATRVQASRGTDVNFPVQGSARQGVLNVAKSKSTPLKYVIMSYVSAPGQAPTVIPASVTYDFGGQLAKFFKMISTNTWASSNVFVGVKDGSGKIIYNSRVGLPAGTAKKVAAARQKLRAGTLKLPSTAKLSTLGAADRVRLSSLGG
jgi:basic membrane lipoprotein Med (substrate-binding protein (PBP1-ABC) superfamily)